jgi:transcriptional regulator with XRE-family HTH domain
MVASPSPHSARCAALLRRQATEQGLSAAQLAESIHTHCGHSRLRAYRLARGWTIGALIAKVRELTDHGHSLTPSRVSRWELDQDNPSRSYREALCQVYRAGPVELGLCAGFTPQAGTAAAVSTHRAAGTAVPHRLEDDIFRRDVLRGLLTTAGGALTAPLLDVASAVRRRMDETLTGSTVSDGTVAYWEEVSARHGRAYKTRPPVPFLADVVADFAEVQLLTDRRLPAGARRDLCAVAARLAGLVGMAMVDLGDYREARGWIHTARLAADETGDRTLRAWVAAREALAHLYFGDPGGAAGSARQAELLARNAVCGAAAQAPALAARAAAALGDAETVRTSLRHAEEAYARVGEQGDGVFSFTEAQLHFYTSHALTTIGSTAPARTEQDAALAGFAPDEWLDPVLVRLDRAGCLLRDGDVVGSVEYAGAVLLAVPEEHRPPIVVKKARLLASAIPPRQRSLPAVRHFHDVLALGT